MKTKFALLTSSKFKYFLFFIIIMFFFLAKNSFARDGQINIDEIIKRQEIERQNLEKITATLNHLNGKINTTIRNKEDGIVKDDDTSDEINIDYFVSILLDNKFFSILKEYAKKIVNYIDKKSYNPEKKEISLIYFSIIIIPSFIIAILFNSVAPVSAKETYKFYMVIRENIPNLEDFDKKNSQIVENQINNIPRYNINESINRNEEIENNLTNQDYALDSYQKLGQLAIEKLESFSNDSEFKFAYNHFQKKRVLSGRALEDISQEANEINNNSSDINRTFITLLMISKYSNKYAGNEINDINYELNCMDIAYLESLTNNEINLENNTIWNEKTNKVK